MEIEKSQKIQLHSVSFQNLFARTQTSFDKESSSVCTHAEHPLFGETGLYVSKKIL